MHVGGWWGVTGIDLAPYHLFPSHNPSANFQQAREGKDLSVK